MVGAIAFTAGIVAASLAAPEGASPDAATPAAAAARGLEPTGPADTVAVAPDAPAARDGGTAALPGSPAATGRAAAAAPVKAGVSDAVVKIGFGSTGLGPLTAINPAYDYGDMKSFGDAVIQSWTRDGILPVHGRTIELVHRSFGAVSQEEQRAVCVAWAEDDGVFAVVGVRRHIGAAQCLTQEFGIPTLIGDSLADEDYANGYLFSVGMAAPRQLRNFAHWAHEMGVLKGAPIGVYYPTGAESLFNDNFISIVEDFGYTVAAEVTTDSPAVGGPQDQLAAERFRVAGVEAAFLFTTVASQLNFMRHAESQRYKPQYLQSDFLFLTDPGLAKTLPPDQHDGALGVTSTRPWDESDPANPKPPTALGEKCHEMYREHTGKNQEGKSLAESTLRMTCDVLTVLLRGLQAAGPDLTKESFVRGLETGLQHEEMAYAATVTFGPGKHAGTEEAQTIRWLASCLCWRVESGFRPLWVQ